MPIVCSIVTIGTGNGRDHNMVEAWHIVSIAGVEDHLNGHIESKV